MLLVGDLAAAAERPRSFVQPGDEAAAARHPRELAHHPPEVEGVVERRDAVREIECAGRERQVLAVGLDTLEHTHPPLVEDAAPKPDQRVGENVRADVLAAERHKVLRAPALRRPDLEHSHARPCALEQEREGMFVRAPVAVVPAEVAAEEGEVRVGVVVRLVPALLPGHGDPPLDLAPLLGDPRQIVVEHAWNSVLDRVARAAAGAAEARPLLDDGPFAEGTAEGDRHGPDVESRSGKCKHRLYRQ